MNNSLKNKALLIQAFGASFLCRATAALLPGAIGRELVGLKDFAATREGASAADLVKSMQANRETAVQQRKAA